MSSLDLRPGQRVHFVGIGGIGMSWLAELLHAGGCDVSGSDREASAITERLSAAGIEIQIGHSAQAVGDAEILVHTPAVGSDNVEVAEGRRRGISILRRRELLGEVTRGKRVVAVAGTHGKTTTTAMVASVLEAGGLDPTVLVGGLVQGTETNLRIGSDRVWVVEADEYDRAFLELNPFIGIVTSLEADHLDQYGDEASVVEAFTAFVNRLDPAGAAGVCVDAPTARALCDRVKSVTADRVLSYATGSDARLRATEIATQGFGSRFCVVMDDSELGSVELSVPGHHNVANALAAVAAGLILDVPWTSIAEGLARFKGVRRRFEILGESAGVMVVSDYAHHPTEIRATLAAARAGWKGRITAAFQPHTFSRTRDFMPEFAAALAEADRVVITEIYPAREEPIPGVTGEAVAEAVRLTGHQDTLFIEDLDALGPRLAGSAETGDLLLMMGAGSIERAASEVWRRLSTARPGRRS